MPPKRQNESRASDELSGRERKKQKTAITRTIAVQDVDSTLAGPSQSVRFDSKFLLAQCQTTSLK